MAQYHRHLRMEETRLSQLIREARIRNGDLTLVWLNLANAYGSIPHQLISVALEHYHIPDQAQKLVKEGTDGAMTRSYESSPTY